jgi:hypothetical protein
VKLRIAFPFGAAAALAAVLASPAAALDSTEQNRFLSPERGATLTGGSLVEARWSFAAPAGDADEAELVLSLDGGRTFPVRVSAELSPDARSYRWRVPSLSSATARLALRVGADHEKGRESIVAVSAQFTIAAAGPEPESLVRGASEWWTRQALSERTVRDILETSVEPEGDRLVAPSLETDADRPPQALSLAVPSAEGQSTPPSLVLAGARSQRASLPPASSSPLRL